jgi:sugar lactone lactonase YvrE
MATPALACVVLTVYMAAPASIRTVAGTGQAGFRGDGGAATIALLNQPFGVEADAEGNLYIADMANHRIRRVDARTGRIATVAGSGEKGFGGDGGKATLAALDEPYGLALDRDGSLFIVDRLNARVRRVDGREATIETVAGTGERASAADGVPGVEAPLREPNDIALRGRELFIADVADHRVRRLDLRTGILTTYAGTGRRGARGDGGPAWAADLNGPRALTLDRSGNLVIVEREGNRVRRVERATGTITTLAGTGARGYTGDGGPARDATFNGPKGIGIDRQDNLYVVDTENHCVRRIDARTRTITTVAGCGKAGPGGDGGPATAAELDRPHGACVDRDGALLIADSSNHRVRKTVLARSRR